MKLIELIRDTIYITKKTVDYLFVIPVITIIFMLFVDAEFNLNMFIERIQQIKSVEHLKAMYILSLLMSFAIFVIRVAIREPTSFFGMKRNGFYCEQFGFMIKKSEITAKKEDENDIYHFSFSSQDDVRKTLVELLGKINNREGMLEGYFSYIAINCINYNLQYKGGQYRLILNNDKNFTAGTLWGVLQITKKHIEKDRL